MNQSLNPEPIQPPRSEAATHANRAADETAELTKRSQNGARNFYWIAALSAINSLVLGFGGDSYFVVGLAGTLFVDGMFTGLAEAMPDIALVLKIIGLTISLLIAGVVALIGYLSVKGRRWAFLLGIVFYVIDTLLMLAFQDWMGLLFHAIFLFGLIGGFGALNKLQKLAPKEPTDFPQNIGGS